MHINSSPRLPSSVSIRELTVHCTAIDTCFVLVSFLLLCAVHASRPPLRRCQRLTLAAVSPPTQFHSLLSPQFSVAALFPLAVFFFGLKFWRKIQDARMEDGGTMTLLLLRNFESPPNIPCHAKGLNDYVFTSSSFPWIPGIIAAPLWPSHFFLHKILLFLSARLMTPVAPV